MSSIGSVIFGFSNGTIAFQFFNSVSPSGAPRLVIGSYTGSTSANLHVQGSINVSAIDSGNYARALLCLKDDKTIGTCANSAINASGSCTCA